MVERLPTLYPMPRDLLQHRICYEAAHDNPTRAAFSARLQQRLLREDGRPYDPQMAARIETNLLSVGFIDEDDTSVKLPDYALSWADGSEDGFRSYVRNTVRRWGTLFHDGLVLAIDLLSVLDNEPKAEKDIVRMLLGTPNQPGKYDPRDTTADRTVREILKVLKFAGWVVQHDNGKYTIGPEGRKPATDLRQRDPLYRAECIFRQVDPAETPVFKPEMKVDLAKYYIYRQCGGKGRSDAMKYASRAIFKGEPKLNKNGVLSPPKLQPAIIKEQQRVKSDREKLKSAIRKISGALGKQVQPIRSVDLLRAILASANGGDLPTAAAIADQSGARFSWEGLRFLQHSGPPYTLRPGMTAYQWQNEALDKWERADRKGVLAVVTGAGKTVFAMMAVASVVREHRNLRVTVLVPTKVLLYQWSRELVRVLGVPPEDIGLRGDGHKDSFARGKRIMVTIVNSAIQGDYLGNDVASLPAEVPHLLIADECHRYRGEEFQHAFDCRKTWTLGLSATPTDAPPGATQELDENDIVQRSCGPVFHSYTYKDGLEDGIIQPFVVNYVAVDLLPGERALYDGHSRKIGKALEKIRQRYGPRLNGMRASNWDQKLQVLLKDDDPDPALYDYFTFVRQRKDLVFGALNRKRCYLDLITRHTIDKPGSQDRVIVFQERIEQLEEIVAPFDRRRKYLGEEGSVEDSDTRPGELAKYREAKIEKAVDLALVDLFLRRDFRAVMYHSGHAKPLWNDISMALFRAGIANVMLSVKALVEGVDVPQANVGIIRASSSSVRQRIQTIGRVLRRATGKEGKAIMYVIYVRKTTDERIFRDANWNEQFGTSAIESVFWNPPENESSVQGKLHPIDLPDSVSFADDDLPFEVDVTGLQVGEPYPGRYAGLECHVDSRGRPFRKARNGRSFIASPEIREAAMMIQRIKGGGKFLVTPQGHIVTRAGKGLIFLGAIRPDSIQFQNEPTSGRVARKPATSFEDLFR